MSTKALLWIGVLWLALPCAWLLLMDHGVHIHAHVASSAVLLPLHYFLLLGWILPLGLGLYRRGQHR